MATLDYVDIFSIGLIVINYVIFLPLFIYWILKFRFHSNDPHFSKRYPSLLYYLVSFGLLYLLIDRPFHLLTNVISLTNKYSHTNFIILIQSLISCFTLLISSLFFLERTWLLYYDHNYHLGRSDVWRRNVGSIVTNKNWFDLKKNTFGKLTFLRKISCILWLIISIIIILFSIILIDIHIIRQLIACVFILIFILSVIYLIKGIQLEWDFVYIRVELTYDLIFILCATITYIIDIALAVPDSSYRLKDLCITSIIVLFIHLILYMSVAFPLKTYYKSQLKQARLSVVMPNRQSKVLPLEEILKDAEAFELFMFHLVKEFSVENLLFICELNQFKQYLQNGILKPNNNPNNGLQAGLELFIVILPNDIIPKSSILKYSKSHLAAGRKLYQKYIINGCEFEINISSRTRNELHDFFNVMYPHNPEDLMVVKSNHNVLIKRHPDPVNNLTATETFLTNLTIPGDNDNSDDDDSLPQNVSAEELIKKKRNSDKLIIDAMGIDVDNSNDDDDDDDIDDKNDDLNDTDLDKMVNNITTKRHSEKEVLKHLSMAFDGPSELDLFSVFDHAKDEVFSVLKDSYQRFSCSEDYHRIEPKILRKHRKKPSQSFRKNMLANAKKMLVKQLSSGRVTQNQLSVGIELNSNSCSGGSGSASRSVGSTSPTPSSQQTIDTTNNKHNHQIIELST